VDRVTSRLANNPQARKLGPDYFRVADNSPTIARKGYFASAPGRDEIQVTVVEEANVSGMQDPGSSSASGARGSYHYF